MNASFSQVKCTMHIADSLGALLVSIGFVNIRLTGADCL